MKILAIETSADETGVAILGADGGIDNPSFSVLSNVVLSQAQKHAEYGGIFPNLAKREHSRNIIPVFKQALIDAKIFEDGETEIDREKLSKLFSHEPELLEQFLEVMPTIQKPDSSQSL